MIYDKFVRNVEWQRLNALRETPGLAHKDRDILLDALREREDAIRKEDAEEFQTLCRKHKEKAFK